MSVSLTTTRTTRTTRLLCIAAVLWTSLLTPVAAQPSGIDDSLALAQASITKRDWATAESILQSISRNQPNNPFVFYEMAQVYENTNRLEAAKQIYQGIAAIPEANQRQYTVVVRSTNVSYMTSLIALAQTKLNTLNATAAAKPAMAAAPIAVKAAPAPAVVAAPIAAPIATQPTVPAQNASTEVTAAMQLWARSWVNKDLKGYFGSYVSAFKGDAPNAGAWRKARTDFIGSKKSMALDFYDMKITPLSPEKAQMSFKQIYTSGAYKSVTNKTLIWAKQGSTWVIEKESTKK